MTARGSQERLICGRGFARERCSWLRRFATCFVPAAAVLTVLVLSPPGPALAEPPEFKAPPDANVSFVAEEMILNGIPMQVRRFTTQAGVEEVVDFYRKEWGDGTPAQPGFVVNTMTPPWFVISRMEDDYLMTVQVQHAGKGAWGYLGLSRLSERQRGPVIGKYFPMPAGSQTLNELISKDPGKKGRTMQILNEQSLVNNVNFYRNHYQGEGWAVDMDRALGSHMHVLTVRKGRTHVNLVITEDQGKSRIVVNEVTNDLL
jgi:hypothetical protein